MDKARWQEIRDRLREEVYRWQKALQQPRDLEEIELSGIVGSVAHLAYHLGAIRQIHATPGGRRKTPRKGEPIRFLILWIGALMRP